MIEEFATVYNPETERLDRINDSLSLIQRRDGFLFGTDSVALCDFAMKCLGSKAKKYRRAIDLGTGSAVIPLILASRGLAEHFTALELQPIYADIARRNASLNALESRIAVAEGDIRASERWKPSETIYDLVVSNPPYMKRDAGLISPTAHRDIARREICCDIRDVCRCAGACLGTGGDFIIVHRADRLTSLICALREYSLEPKTITLQVPNKDKPASIVLVHARKDSGEELRVWVE